MTIKVTLSRPPAAVEFEVGSFAEVVGMLSDNESTLVNLFSIADRMNGASEGTGGEVPAATEGAAPTETKTRKPRTPRVEAVAPAPLPVPGATPVPPTPPNLAPAPDGGIPPFLARTPEPPAPPPLPNAPPIAPAAPVNSLAPKVVAELETRAKGSADGGKALADWLASCGLVKAGSNYADALSVVAIASDVQLAQVADLLKLA